MTDRVLVQLSGGAWLALSTDVFVEALRAGQEAMGATVAAAAAQASDSEPLVDAEKLAEDLGVPCTRIEALARERRIPSVRIGRYIRFRRSAVEAALEHA